MRYMDSLSRTGCMMTKMGSPFMGVGTTSTRSPYLGDFSVRVIFSTYLTLVMLMVRLVLLTASSPPSTK